MVRMGDKLLLGWVGNGTFDTGVPLFFHCPAEAIESL
jgi:hypothetical protein